MTVHKTTQQGKPMKTKTASKQGKGVAEPSRQRRCLLTEGCPHELKQILVPTDTAPGGKKA